MAITLIPIVWVRKLRHRETRKLSKVRKLQFGKAGIPAQAIRPSSILQAADRALLRGRIAKGLEIILFTPCTEKEMDAQREEQTCLSSHSSLDTTPCVKRQALHVAFGQMYLNPQKGLSEGVKTSPGGIP